MLSDMPFIYGTVAVGGVVPFLSVVALVRRVFCRIKSSLKLFFFFKYNQGIFNTYQSFHGNNTQCYVSQLVCAL